MFRNLEEDGERLDMDETIQNFGFAKVKDERCGKIKERKEREKNEIAKRVKREGYRILNRQEFCCSSLVSHLG